MSWGLVLSGGSAYGLTNAGVLGVLEREGLKPDAIAGSSMGAVIASLAALGYPASVFDEFTHRLNLRTVARFHMGFLFRGLHGGFFRQNIESLLRDLIGDKRIGETKIPLVIVAGRVRRPIRWTRILGRNFMEEIVGNVEPIVFPKETRILDALMATSAIPVIFSPRKIAEREYIDLVHFGSIPARSLRDTCHPDVVIATDTNPTYETLKQFLPGSWRTFIERGREELDRSKEACDLVIRPRFPAPMFRFDRAAEFVEEGRKAAEKHLPKIRALLSQ